MIFSSHIDFFQNCKLSIFSQKGFAYNKTTLKNKTGSLLITCIIWFSNLIYIFMIDVLIFS